MKCKKDLYQRASALAIRNVSLTPIEAACKVAATFGVNISVADRHLIGACVRTRVKATIEFPKPDCVSSPKNSLQIDVDRSHVNDRIGKRKVQSNDDKDDDVKTSSRRNKAYHGVAPT